MMHQIDESCDRGFANHVRRLWGESARAQWRQCGVVFGWLAAGDVG
jgi:hypothetical protein